MELEIPPIVEPALPQSQPEPPLNSQPPSSRKKTAWIAVGSVVAFLAIVAAGSYVVFAEGKTSFGNDFQNAMWANIVDSSGNVKAIDTSFTATYQDSGTFNFVPSQFIAKANLDSDDQPDAATLKQYDQDYSFSIANFKSTTSLSGFYNQTNPTNTQGSVEITNDTVNANTDYTATLDAEGIGNAKYLKYDYNQAVADSSVMKLLASFVDPTDDKGQWIKASDSDGDDDQAPTPTPSEAIVNAQMENILKDNRPVDIQSFKGFASVNGHETVHYALAINKANLRTIILDSIKLNNPTISQDDLDYQMQFVDSSIANMKVNDFEVWVSPSDHHVYKFVYQGNALSLTGSLTVLENNLGTLTADMNSGDGGGSAKADALKVFQSLPYTAQFTIQNSVNSYNANEQVQPPKVFKDESDTDQSDPDSDSPLPINSGI